MTTKRPVPVNLAQALGVDEAQIAALMILGHSCFQQGKLQESRDIFEGLLVLDPKNPYACSVLGAIHQAEESYDKAVHYYTLALKQHPDDMNTLTNRAEIYLNQGKFEEAAGDLQKAIELDPGANDPAANRARFLAAFAMEALNLADEKGVEAVHDAARRLEEQISV